MTRTSLVLYPYAGENFGNEVTACLRGLGYPLLAAKGHDCEANRIGVILWDGDRSRRAQVADAISSRSGAPRFCILPGLSSTRDHALLEQCHEFCCWPVSAQELSVRLERLERLLPEQSSDDELARELMSLNLVGDSSAFRYAFNRLRQFAGCDAPVLIQGETGTGKELAARAVHYLSERRDFPFIPVNCGALPDDLLENELFGHEKGAYTDARDPYAGLVAQAEGGTLFLDEVEALSPKGQVVLLRFLQSTEYRPLGSSRQLTGNIRVVAASNAPLEQLVEQKAFREDLFFRLNILPVTLPPLRKREQDVALLTEHFLQLYQLRYGRPGISIHPTTLGWMQCYSWPGNVRELENLLHREFLLASDGFISIPPPGEAEQPGFGVSLDPAPASSFNEAKANAVAAFERDYLLWLMREVGGNVSQAARLAGKERRCLGKLLKKHGIDKKQFA